MPDADRTKQPWERQARETTIAFAAFCQYRDMGAERSIKKAVEAWLSTPPPKRAPKRVRENRRYLTCEKPENYVRNKTNRWKLWSRRWEWVKRVRAWDEFAAAEAEHKSFEAQVEGQLEEQAERERQRKTRLGGARLLRTVATTAAAELGAAIQAGEHKQILTCPKCGEVMGSDRLARLAGIARQIAPMFDKGAMHERLEEKQPTSITESRVSMQQVRQIADIIRRKVPEEERDEVAAAIDRVLDGHLTETME